MIESQNDAHIAVSSAILAIGAAVIPVTMFLDSNLSDEWRAKVSNVLRTGSLRQGLQAEPEMATWRAIAKGISRLAGELFQTHGVRSFVQASVILSLTI